MHLESIKTKTLPSNSNNNNNNPSNSPSNSSKVVRRSKVDKNSRSSRISNNSHSSSNRIRIKLQLQPNRTPRTLLRSVKTTIRRWQRRKRKQLIESRRCKRTEKARMTRRKKRRRRRRVRTRKTRKKKRRASQRLRSRRIQQRQVVFWTRSSGSGLIPSVKAPAEMMRRTKMPRLTSAWEVS